MADRTVKYTFTGSFTNLTAGLTAAGRNATELGTKLTALDKNGAKMRAGLTQIGDTAGKVGLLFAAGVGAAIGVAANFDKAMSSVQAATHETADNMDALREAAIKAGADTAYSASEAAGAIEELAKAGVSTKDILGGGLAGSLDLAAAGAIEVSDAAEIAATAMTQFKLGGDQVVHVADLLAAGAGKAQGGVDDLGMALKQSGLVASQTGLSIEETTGTLAAFASAGLIGSDAGTSFKTMLQSLTPSSKEAADLMNELGISAYDAQGNFVGMTEFAGVLQNALQDMSVEQQNAALKTIFGADAVRAASVVFQEGAGGIQGWIDKTNDSGYAAETAATRLDNLSGDLEQFKGSLETALIGAGEGSQGPLRKLVQGATDVVNAFNDLPGPAKNATVALGGLVAITGGSLWFGAKVVSGIADTKQALHDLGIESGKVKGALKGLGIAAGIGTALFAVSTAIEEIESRSLRAVPGVEALTQSLIHLGDEQTAQKLREQIGDIGDAMAQLDDPGFWGKLDNFADSAPLGLGNLSHWASPVISIGISNADEAADEATASLNALDEALANVVNSGSADIAKQTFDDLALTYGLTDDQQTKLLSHLPQYKEALAGSANAADLAAAANGDLADETGAASVAAAKAANRQQALADKLREQREAARNAARGWIGLGDSLDNAKKSLGDWLRQLENQAEALRNFTQNARTAAKRGLDDGLIKSLNEAGPAGALRMKQLANATDAEIKRANSAWRNGQRAIREYVNMQVPPKKIKVDTSQAVAAVSFLQARIDSLRSKTIAIDIATGQKRAGGGPIYGPGTKTSDSVPVMASRGEFMMSAAAVDHYGLDTMFKMNARHLASGGDVSGRTPRARGDLLGFGSLEYILGGLNELTKRELEIRQRQVSKLERVAERQDDLAQQRLEAERADLKDLRDARKQFMQEVSSNFRSDVFGGQVDLVQAYKSGLIGGDAVNPQLYAFMAQQQALAKPGDTVSTNSLDYLDAFFASLSADQTAALQAQASVGQLGRDANSANSFESVLEQLASMGLTGGAYNELASSGNLALAQAYLQQGAGFVQDLATSYRNRNQELRDLGAAVGNVRFGADIREQLQATRQAVRVAERSQVELREIKQASREMTRRLERLERLAEKAPKETADKQSAALNGAIAHGQRRA